MNPPNNTGRPITEIFTEQELQEKIKRGVDTLNFLVGATLGARGRMVGIDRGYENVTLRDGVSVAKSLFLEDRASQFAVSIMREAAQKTVQEVGDGTTATIILAHALYTEGMKLIAQGIHPRSFIEPIEKDVLEAIRILNSVAIPVDTLSHKIQVATVSCEEASLGKIIGETLDRVGEEGVVTVEHSKTGSTYVDMQEGMQWDRGLASPYFMTDPQTLSGVIENGHVLVTDLDITNIMEIKPFLDDFITHSRFLTIIAPDFGGDALSSLIANKVNNVLLSVCIKAPSFGGQQTSMLQDIALLTGATFITKEQGHKLEDVRFTHLGKASRITATQTMTILSGGEGDKKLIAGRIEELKKLVSEETNDFELERLRERLAKLTNGVAVIRVGGHTDIETKERFERALDATLATRQAVKTGIVPGGETVYLSLIPHMKSDIMKKALVAPFSRLVENAGFNSGQLIERLSVYGIDGVGIDVTDGEIKDMIGVGIIDPVAAPIAALQNATSVAIQLLNCIGVVLPKDVK